MQNDTDLSFVIPTNRLRDIGETVEEYDEHFWRNGHSPQIILFDDSTPIYVLVNFRPVITRKNWRMDCRVAAYDNTFGLPPFFPTRLRFEDYIYRLWIQQDGIVAAHVDASQHHLKSNYMRNPPAAEIFNEEVCNLLKRKIKSTVSHKDALSITFDYDGEVTLSMRGSRVLSLLS
jgi:hypothetical protein